MQLTSALPSWNCSNQPVFLRADLNVPLKDSTILNDRRLQAIRPTLDSLLKQNAIIVLATHLGRPNNKEDALSTRHLLPWFEKHEYQITFCATLDDALAQQKTAVPGSILLLENLRFFKEEREGSLSLAHRLAQLADCYVNDAFGALHRHDTSITLLPKQFAPDKRTIGLLVEKELAILSKFLQNPQHPVCIILGGNKISSKLPMIEHLLTIADHIILCPAIVFTFLKALGKPVGKSIVEDEELNTARTILHRAPQESCDVHFPVDYQIAQDSLSGPLSVVPADQLPADSMGISIGPESEKLFADIIASSKTTFFNGAIGFLDRPETLQGMQSILSAMAHASGTSLVTGGDSLAALDQLGITGITHTITGGGSALAYLSGKTLPGLKPFID
ncbi:phosphoglycerate kinase [Candidatus Dependentiae bacterium]|nr:MAG: phosphoglycerate kinase [Candidatus Dependentiae bacterium]